MSEFKVDSEIIKESIETLKKLLDKCEEAYDKEIPRTDVDKGLVHSELDSLCESMKITCQYLGELINNTIAFLNGSSEMFDTSDQESATVLLDYVVSQETVKTLSQSKSTVKSQTANKRKNGVNAKVDIGNYVSKVSDVEFARLCSRTNKLFDKKNPAAKDFINLIKEDSYFSDHDPLKNISEEQVTVISEGSGFGAVIIEDGNNAIVIFSGTNVESRDIGDFATDGSVLFGTWNFQGKQAIDLVNDLSKKYDNIVVSGHSLGGYLATAATLKNDSVSKCVTFDPPGRYDAVIQETFHSDRTSVITSYEARGSLISSVGYDVGEVHRIAVKESGGFEVAGITIDKNHSIENLCDAMGGADAMHDRWD